MPLQREKLIPGRMFIWSLLTTPYKPLKSRAIMTDYLTNQFVAFFSQILTGNSQNDSEGVDLAQKQDQIWTQQGQLPLYTGRLFVCQNL